MHLFLRLFVVLFLFPYSLQAAVDLSSGRSSVLSYAGSFNHKIAIPVAPGRAGTQPALQLGYSSAMSNGLYGVGWDLGITRIERETKFGAPRYTNADKFVMVMNGVRQSLVKVGAGEYRMANESAFLKITKQGNSWVVRDKKNTVYYFGGAYRANQQASWPVRAPQAFSWHLSRVEDVTRSNVMHYFYADGGLGHRLIRVEYAPNNRVDLLYKARPDVIQSYRSGKQQVISLRLSSIQSFAGNRLASDMQFTYQSRVNDNRSVLSSVAVKDVNKLLPDQMTTFDYAYKGKDTRNGYWNPIYSYSFRNYNSQWTKTQRFYFDINGDGSNEWMSYVTHRGGKYQFSTSFSLPAYTGGNGWLVPRYWQPGRDVWMPGKHYATWASIPFSQKKNAKQVYFPRALVDMNGDGYMDFIVKDNTGKWRVYLHNGYGFLGTYKYWNNPAGAVGSYSLYDVNGDGLPDLLSGSGLTWSVYLNTTTGFKSQPYTVSLRNVTSIMNRMTPVPATLASQAWRVQPVISSIKNLQSNMVQSVSYGLKAGIANAPTLKLWTVSNISSSGPQVETRSISYSYTGGLFVPSKREFRGFATIRQIDDQTGITTTTNYHQDIVFQGRPKSISTSLNGVVLSAVSNTWQAKSYLKGKRHFAYVGKAVNRQNDAFGSLLTKATTTSEYDTLGHLVNATTSLQDGFSKNIQNTYDKVDTCATVPATVATTVWVKRTPPVWYLHMSPSYQRYSRMARSRNAVIRSRGVALLAAVTATFNARNWGSYPTTVHTTQQLPDETCWKIRHLTQAKITSSSLTDTQTRISSFAYDINGFLISKTIEPTDPALSQSTAYQHDGFGNLTQTTVSGAGITARLTTVAYDANGMFPVNTVNAFGHRESYTWDARFGSKTSLTGPNSLTTAWQYDGFGRKIQEDRADGTFTSIDLSNSPASVTTAASGSNPSTVWYDARGREVKSAVTGFDGSLIYKEVAYDALGRKWKEYLPYTGFPGLFTEFSYDQLSRAIRVTNPNGDVASSSYNGFTTVGTNAKGQTSTTVKNSQGKVVSVTDSNNETMSYAYDANGNLIQTTDAANNITTMSYDIRGRKIGMHDPDMGVWSYEYDVLGNLIRQTDAKNQSTSMQYDLLGRMTSRTEIEGTSSWVYDATWIGALSSESSPLASKSYSYDGFGRVITASSVINGQNYTVSTAYDNLSRVSTLTYPTGLTIQRNYNAFHYMQSISNANTGALIWQADSVDEFGHTISESFGNGVSTTHTYDAVRGTLTGLQSTSNAVQIQNWSYNYDAVGNMQFRTDSIVGYSENFTYDNLNRLNTVKNAAGVLQKSYAYDAIGNITNKSDVGAYTYAWNHPHAVQTAGGNNYAYDANGNQTSGAGRTLTWTSFNKASGIWTANGYTGFTYDASHNRITKVTPTSNTVYIGKIFEEITIGGLAKDRNHIYAGSKLVASIENNVGGLTNTRYMHGDHLGSISVISDELGKVVERLRFDVFGLPVNLDGTAKAMGSSNTSRGYTGHEMDASTGLINMNARLYDPVLGRFLSADTVVPGAGNMQNFNRYAYVLNNPLAYTDPTGHFWHIIIGAIVGGIMAGLQSDWDIGAVFQGAVMGAMAAAIGGEAYGAMGGAGYGIAASGAVAGASAGAFAGFTSTAMNGGGKYLHNTLNGAFFGAVAGAVTGGLIQEFNVNEVIAGMSGAYTSGYMQGGSDNARFALYAAAGAAIVAYVVRGSLGGVKQKSRLQDDGKLYAANDDGTARDFVYSNEDGVEAAGAGTSFITKIKSFFRSLVFRGSVTSKVVGGVAGAGVKALDVDTAKAVNAAIIKTAIMNCSMCSVTDNDYLWQQFNNMNSGIPRSRQNIVDMIHRRNSYVNP